MVQEARPVQVQRDWLDCVGTSHGGNRRAAVSTELGNAGQVPIYRLNCGSCGQVVAFGFDPFIHPGNFRCYQCMRELALFASMIGATQIPKLEQIVHMYHEKPRISSLLPWISRYWRSFAGRD